MSQNLTNLNHIDINNFQEVVDIINQLDSEGKLTTPVIPYLTETHQDGLWHNIDNSETLTSLPSSIYCLDVETICDTRVLVMASCWDLINQKWWVWVSTKGTNPRLSFTGKNVIIAHRSSFELGFIRESYTLDCQIRFLDTHVMACCRYHPGKVNLYRSQPYLPMFRGSNDLSLKELSLKLTGRELNKDVVEVFITATNDDWRLPHIEINKYNLKAFIKHHKLSKSDLSLEDYVKFINPTQLPSDCNIFTSKRDLSQKKSWWITPTMSEMVNYNLEDVAATVGVFNSMWGWYRAEPYEYIAGLYHRSIPLIPLASDWFDKIAEIEVEFESRVGEMVKLVDVLEEDYLKLVENSSYKIQDNFDWGTWGKTCKDKDKVGKYKWLGETGLSSKKLMRLCRLSWQNRPMFVVADSKLDKEGNAVIKKDGTDSQLLRWYTCDKQTDPEGKSDWLYSVSNTINSQVLDNPTSTDKDLKDIVTVFSIKFLSYWESGELTSESEEGQKIAKIYSTISFWNSFRDRILNQAPTYRVDGYNSICLRPLVNGTLTNRAIDSIGLVMSKASENKVGSEIGGHICAPEGWTFVFADFDSIQACITAIYSAISTARDNGVSHLPINVLNNDYSKAVLLGTKEDETTVAWLLAKQSNISYSHGKNLQFAMLFGAGRDKLAAMAGSFEIADKVIKTFKGSRKYGKWEGGIASGYFNFSKELADGLNFRRGKFRQKDIIETSFLGRQLSNILKPSHRGSELGGTSQNAVTQAVDVDCLCYLVDGIITQASKEGIQVRYSTSEHDCLYMMSKVEDSRRLAEIFQIVHKQLFTEFLKEVHIDINSYPEKNLYFSAVDINTRKTKGTGDKGKTVSNIDGYDYELSATIDGLYDEEGVILSDLDNWDTSKNLIKKMKKKLI